MPVPCFRPVPATYRRAGDDVERSSDEGRRVRTSPLHHPLHAGAEHAAAGRDQGHVTDGATLSQDIPRRHAAGVRCRTGQFKDKIIHYSVVKNSMEPILVPKMRKCKIH